MTPLRRSSSQPLRRFIAVGAQREGNRSSGLEFGGD
jgi:hypothetical protein